MPIDLHTHTPLCHHASGTPLEFARAAKAAGLEVYGVSDHAPMPDEPFDDWRMSQADLPHYCKWIEELRVASEGAFQVLAGLECDWIPGIESHTNWLREQHPWDYLIGSIHYLGKDFDFDNPKWLGRWESIDVEETWSAYWKEYLAMVRSGLFDIYGHPDLVKKFGFKPEGDLRRFYEPIIEAIAAQSGCIELNTAGWHKTCAEQYPDEHFLRLAAEAGIRLTLSSDAHAPEELARDFKRAATLALSCGFEEVAPLSGHRLPLKSFL